MAKSMILKYNRIPIYYLHILYTYPSSFYQRKKAEIIQDTLYIRPKRYLDLDEWLARN